MVAVATDRNYQPKISAAEAAVAGMADPQLRQVAFAKILERLLAEAEPARRADATSKRGEVGDRKQRRVAAGRGGPIAHIEELVGEQFFREPKTLGEVR